MKVQKTLGISNRKECVRLILKKEKTYLPFLFNLLKNLKIKIPDIQDEMGIDPEIMEEKDKEASKLYKIANRNFLK